ncbi:thioesterase domain-containing protein, partial [Streptomyces sp. NPDC048483]|uniref:thioesterase domain-containing protein n=1 Tax=Streptomyces sp. NPDC048483 TaxID=3154927 RepID=UPI0034241545
PVNNVHIHIVDEYLSPVPLGAPGEIVFSGVCVGRGYVNDPERTRSAFTEDPHHPGRRLYRSGDHGRWLPDGKLDFLGRRDAQVKIRGFRIEIGEIESTLLRVPGIRDAAVVVSQDTGHGRRLVAYYAAPRPLEDDALQDTLSRSLPAYMVPSAFLWRESLPLTANGKTDKKTLTALTPDALADEGDTAEDDHHPPGTPAERRLAAAWAKTLGIPEGRIGRQDHFFDLGGTSLTAVRVAICLDRVVSPKDLTRHPVLADLARLVESRATTDGEPLRSLSEPDQGQRQGALVGFPRAGGGAEDFRALATALRGSGPAVYAVEPPGPATDDAAGPSAATAQVAERAAAEIVRRGLTGVLLWGHASGAACAVETARRLQERGVDVQRVFLGAQLLGDAAARHAAVAGLTECGDAELAAAWNADGGRPVRDAQRADRAPAAYRRDCIAAHRYFADALDSPPAGKLTAPVTVVVAADDPGTAQFPQHHRDWLLLAERVDLHELADGGPYFLHTRATEAAKAVLRAAEWPAS